MIVSSTNENCEDSSTPMPIVATTQAPESDDDQSQEGHLIPIHAKVEDNFTQGEYDAYGGGHILNC